MPVQKIDPKVIFASDAPIIDKPPVFGDKTKGFDVTRSNDGRPTIKQMNKLQQDTDLKILWLNENSVTPYDESIDYPDGAVALKDGSFKQLVSGAWAEFLDDFANKDAVKRGIANRYDPLLTYNSGERVVLTNGDIVKSTIDGNVTDPNVDMTGWFNQKEAQDKKNSESISTADFGSVGDGTLHTVREWFESRKYQSLQAIQIKYPHVTSLDDSIDWAAAQKACNVAGQGGAVLIKGCLFFKEGEKLVVPARQKLYGLGSPLFINTNNGLMFTGSLTGDLPEYGIYYDGESGSPLRCGEAVILEGFHLFGKGLKISDGTINILQIHDAEYWPTVGIEVEKFIITDNFSVYYFNEAIKSLQGGNYYSKFSKTEITRCSIAFSYEVSSYNQDFFGVTLREVREPFKFASGAFARSFNYFGGSIEGFRPQVGQDYAVGIPANSFISFKGTYFENLEDAGVFEAAFSPVGTNAVVQFDACTIYLNHFKSWVKQSSQTGFKVVTRGNEFLLSVNSRVKNPTIYDVLQTGTNIATVDTDGSDKIRFVRGYPSIVKSASITSGSKSLVFDNITDVHVGQRIIITSISLETVITGISGNTATLQASSPSAYTGNVDIYFTPSYLPFSIGLPLLNNRIVYPSDYLSYFDDIQFERVSGKAVKARSKAPDSVFNGANSGVSTYVADYSNWNPSGKRDGRGAYPTVYRGGKYYPQLGSFSGSFACSSGTLTIVNDTNVSASSVVLPIPKNVAAANLFKNGYYISETLNSTRFSITFLTAALGTEVFDYTITD